MNALLKGAVLGVVLTVSACRPGPGEAPHQDATQQQEAKAQGAQLPSLPPVSPVSAITAFAGDQVDRSLARLALSITQDPEGTRTAALASLEAESSAVRFAALLALAATADAGESLEALRPFLDSERESERLMAASRLTSMGESSALPTLIQALGSADTLGFSSPPEPSWRCGRRVLLRHTDQDLGLRSAEDAASAARAQAAWEAWWSNSGPTLSWDGETRRFRTGDPTSAEE